MKTFEEMPVWQKAMSVAEEVFKITSMLPRSEDYGLTSQMRRAALSISSNIAEGFGREHTKEKCQFYNFSRGSAFELKNQLIYGIRVGYFKKDTAEKHIQIVDSIIFELNSLKRSIKSRD
jgi:four helix bundle protein